MRYKQLREARTTLENALVHYVQNRGDLDEPSFAEGLAILKVALYGVKLELKKPEQFNLDGTFRRMRMLVNA